jgi:hypothetical protein
MYIFLHPSNRFVVNISQAYLVTFFGITYKEGSMNSPQLSVGDIKIKLYVSTHDFCHWDQPSFSFEILVYFQSSSHSHFEHYKASSLLESQNWASNT